MHTLLLSSSAIEHELYMIMMTHLAGPIRNSKLESSMAVVWSERLGLQ